MIVLIDRFLGGRAIRPLFCRISILRKFPGKPSEAPGDNRFRRPAREIFKGLSTKRYPRQDVGSDSPEAAGIGPGGRQVAGSLCQAPDKEAGGGRILGVEYYIEISLFMDPVYENSVGDAPGMEDLGGLTADDVPGFSGLVHLSDDSRLLEFDVLLKKED